MHFVGSGSVRCPVHGSESREVHGARSLASKQNNSCKKTIGRFVVLTLLVVSFLGNAIDTAIRYDIRYTIYDIRCTVYDIRYTNIRYTNYGIRYTIYDIRYTSYDIRYAIYDIQYTITHLVWVKLICRYNKRTIYLITQLGLFFWVCFTFSNNKGTPCYLETNLKTKLR